MVCSLTWCLWPRSHRDLLPQARRLQNASEKRVVCRADFWPLCSDHKFHVCILHLNQNLSSDRRINTWQSNQNVVRNASYESQGQHHNVPHTNPSSFFIWEPYHCTEVQIKLRFDWGGGDMVLYSCGVLWWLYNSNLNLNLPQTSYDTVLLLCLLSSVSSPHCLSLK